MRVCVTWVCLIQIQNLEKDKRAKADSLAQVCVYHFMNFMCRPMYQFMNGMYVDMRAKADSLVQVCVYQFMKLYVCMYVDMRAKADSLAQICVCIRLRMYVFMYVWKDTPARVYLYHKHVYMHVCTLGTVYVCNVYIYTFKYVYLWKIENHEFAHGIRRYMKLAPIYMSFIRANQLHMANMMHCKLHQYT
jgi:hypothetical protein